jgi:hypothetical protein
MFVDAVMVAMCFVAVAFYLAFLVGLFRECPPRATGYWVRLRLGSAEDILAESQERSNPVRRAA